MDYKELTLRTSGEALIKLASDKILQGIVKVEENPEISSRRWLWELMQNARDVPNKWGGVSIKLILTKESIKICHNGNPFSLKNLINLIQQVSSKVEEDEDDFVGKFGTGFMVTHLLSKKLKLKGVLHEAGLNSYLFNIEIDRDATNSTDLSKKMQDLISEVSNADINSNFKKIVDFNKAETDFETIFEFPLNEKSLKYAKDGIADMVNTLPLTQIFVEKIKNLIVDDKIKGKVYNFEKKFHENTNVYEIISDVKSDYFWIKSNEDIQIALRVLSATDLTPIKWNEDTPKIYRDFPLIGSEKFHSPFVINSNKFYPDETRSGLYLVNEENTQVISNREILASAYILAQSFIEELGDNTNNYLFANSKIPSILRDDVKSWYEKNVQEPYQLYILNNLTAKTLDGNYKIFKEIKIPCLEPTESYKQDEFYQICADFYAHSEIVNINEFKYWQKAIKTDYNDWDVEFKISIDDLIKEIEDTDFSELAELSTAKEIVNKFNALFSFLHKNGMTNIIESEKIIPNSLGELYLLNELSINSNIQDVFLQIIELDQPQYRNFLIHEDVKICISHEKKTTKDVLREIDDLIKEDDFGIDEDERNLIYQFLRLQFDDKISFKSKVLKAYCDLFKFKYEYNIMKREEDNFDFGLVTKKAIRIILNRIEELQNLDSLSICIDKTRQETINWLSDLLLVISDSSTHSEILGKNKVFPNFHEEFSSYSAIFNIGSKSEPIPSEIINLHEKMLTNSELKDCLLSPYFNFEMGKMKSLSEICNDLDEKAKETYTYWGSSNSLEKNNVLELLEWVSKDSATKQICEKHFNWFKNFKPHVLLLKFEEGDVKEAMFSILKSDGDKIVALSRIIENKTIEELNNFALIFEKYTDKEVDELILLSEELEDVKIEDVRNFIAEKKEEKSDFIFKKSIGNTFELLFKEYFDKQNLDFQIQKRENPADFKIVNNGLTYYVELKSIAKKNENKIIKMSFNQANVATVSKENYALCVLERPEDWKMIVDTGAGLDYISKKVKVVRNIGKCIEEGFLKTLDFKNSLLDSDMNGVGVEFKDNDFKMTVKSEIWNSGTSLEELFIDIKNKLSV